MRYFYCSISTAKGFGWRVIATEFSSPLEFYSKEMCESTPRLVIMWWKEITKEEAKLFLEIE